MVMSECQRLYRREKNYMYANDRMTRIKKNNLDILFLSVVEFMVNYKIYQNMIFMDRVTVHDKGARRDLT